MSRTTPAREAALHLIREERIRQLETYGSNNTTPLGFGGSVLAYPWLTPFSTASGEEVEAAFRRDYELYEGFYGGVTWMHLIREEVAELFATTNVAETVDEAVQVAALCVSLIERLTREGEVA